MRRLDKIESLKGHCIMENILVETVKGPVPVKAITGRHRVLGIDGKFYSGG